MHLSDCLLCIICTIVRYSMQRFLMLHAEQDEFFLCIMRDWVQAVPQIGLFLGYPPEDVEGFILNHAKGYKCIGCWKVYGDEQAARKKFEAFNLCTKCCCSYRNRGMSVEKMVVREKPDTPVQ